MHISYRHEKETKINKNPPKNIHSELGSGTSNLSDGESNFGYICQYDRDFKENANRGFSYPRSPALLLRFYLRMTSGNLDRLRHGMLDDVWACHTELLLTGPSKTCLHVCASRSRRRGYEAWSGLVWSLWSCPTVGIEVDLCAGPG
jgi:hypothetical protein